MLPAWSAASVQPNSTIAPTNGLDESEMATFVRSAATVIAMFTHSPRMTLGLVLPSSGIGESSSENRATPE